MKSHELQVSSNSDSIRPGRGISAGRGKTAGRGTKGQNSRSGGKRRPGFEGGQTPIHMRIPKKRGFNTLKREVLTVYTGDLDRLGVTVDNTTLFEASMITDQHKDVKVITKGEVKKKHNVSLRAASVAAIAMIENVGGSFNKLETTKKPKTKVTK